MTHIVLLGDSIFDNQSYVGCEPDVVGHLRKLLPPDWKATLCAVDGSVCDSVARQVPAIPPAATHLVLSVGGNDALPHASLLADTTRSGTELLGILSGIADEFAVQYRAAVQCLLRLQKPLCLCTIYNGNLGPPLDVPARAAVAVFNDRIYQVANECHLPVLELRVICTQPSDYANPIEPSGSGGAKIAAGILAQVQRIPQS